MNMRIKLNKMLEHAKSDGWREIFYPDPCPFCAGNIGCYTCPVVKYRGVSCNHPKHPHARWAETTIKLSCEDCKYNGQCPKGTACPYYYHQYFSQEYIIKCVEDMIQEINDMEAS